MNQKTTISDQEIESFLAASDNDPIRAVKAIASYSKSHQQIKRPTYTPSGPLVVNVKQAKKTYKVGRQRVTALNGVSLKIYDGEFVALTGASGSGKSTLLQLIGGLDKPTEGVVGVDGVDLSKLRDSKLSKFRGETIGFVFQFFYLQPFLRVGKNLEVPAMFARTKRRERVIQAQKLADSVGITDRINHLPRELSGGQMQRVAVARALMNRPKLLLADEPTGNLDSVNSAAIIELFEAIRKEFGTTIIVVTHDPQIAARADREIRLKDGVVL